MKTKYLLLALLLFSTAHAQTPIGTSFTYQGELMQLGAPADGDFDFQFEMYDSEAACCLASSTLLLEDIPVANGMFTVELDFGAGPYAGDQLWLEIGVRDGASTGGFTGLLPRQKMTAVPFALHAEAVALGSVGSEEINVMQVQRRISEACPDGAINSGTGTAIVGVDELGQPSCREFTRTDHGHDLPDPAASMPGTIFYADNGVWAALPPGTSGQILKAGPVWGAETDPQVASTTTDQWCRGSGSAVTCDQPKPAISNQSCLSGHVTGIDSAGNIICSAMVGFLARRNSVWDWPLNASVQAIPFDMEIYDHGNDFDGTTGTFTAPAAGLYSFHGTIEVQSVSIGDLIYVFIEAAGKNYYGVGGAAGRTNFNLLHVSAVVHMDVGQTAKLIGYISDSNPPGQVYGNAASNYMFSFFQAELLN
jgi:hypothetical protein